MRLRLNMDIDIYIRAGIFVISAVPDLGKFTLHLGVQVHLNQKWACEFPPSSAECDTESSAACMHQE